MLGTAFALLPRGSVALAYALLSTLQVDYGLDESQIAKLQVWNTIAAADGYALTALATIGRATQISQVGPTSVVPAVFFGSISASATAGRAPSSSAWATRPRCTWTPRLRWR